MRREPLYLHDQEAVDAMTFDQYLEAVADDACARAMHYMEGDRAYALREAERAKERARRLYGGEGK